MIKLLRYLKGYEKETILAPFFKMLEAIFELLIPLVVASIMDEGIKNNNVGHIWKMCVVMVLFGVIGLTCSLTAQFFAAKSAMGFSTSLREDMFNHISKFSYYELDKLGTPTLVTRITNDINQAQTGVNLFLRLFLRAPFIVIGAIIMSFIINPKITLVFLITLFFISTVIFLVMKWTVPIYKQVQGILDKISLITRENHLGVRVVRAFSRQKNEKEDFSKANKEYTSLQIFAGKVSALLNPLTSLFMNLGIVGILWFGGKEVFNGSITQGQVVALINYMVQILIALLALINLVVAITKALASAPRINEVFETMPTLSDSDNKDQEEEEKEKAPRVEFKNVSFTYANTNDPALTNINFEAMPGEVVGIIGGTGSGKSTLINLIPRFYDVTKGEIFIDGVLVEKYPFKQLRNKIGIVPQEAILFKGTVGENIRWGKEDASDEEIYDALTISQSKGFVEEKPDKLDTMINQGGSNLSGGQQQRLTIARAIVRKPKILILDDSSSALDYATDLALRKAIREDIDKMTLFIVSQRVASIKDADKIIVLDEGQIAGVGDHKGLLETCDVYKEICSSQLTEEEASR